MRLSITGSAVAATYVVLSGLALAYGLLSTDPTEGPVYVAMAPLFPLLMPFWEFGIHLEKLMPSQAWQGYLVYGLIVFATAAVLYCLGWATGGFARMLMRAVGGSWSDSGANRSGS
jgi:hypothetical protein